MKALVLSPSRRLSGCDNMSAKCVWFVLIHFTNQIILLGLASSVTHKTPPAKKRTEQSRDHVAQWKTINPTRKCQQQLISIWFDLVLLFLPICRSLTINLRPRNPALLLGGVLRWAMRGGVSSVRSWPRGPWQSALHGHQLRFNWLNSMTNVLVCCAPDKAERRVRV